MTRSASLTERAYQRLRDDLLTCRLAPGDRLSIKELSAELGVSLGAVREALSRLTSEGFVTAQPQRGFRAAPITVEDLIDLVRVRVNIEGQCLRRSIEIGNAAWEANVTDALDRLSQMPMAVEGAVPRMNNEYAAAHAAFHAATCAACDSIWLLRMREWLYAQSERYRYLAVPLNRRHRDIGHEHAELARAALSRDADTAVALLEAHLDRTAGVLLESIGFTKSLNGSTPADVTVSGLFSVSP